jgi:hypothetical protein
MRWDISDGSHMPSSALAVHPANARTAAVMISLNMVFIMLAKI